MRKNSIAFIILGMLIIGWMITLNIIYQKGQEKEAVIYVEIPEETKRFIEGLLNTIDLAITFDPDLSIDDWNNENDFGNDESSGLAKLEDEYFVFYYAKNDQKEKNKAHKAQKWAHEAIPELADLMGKYHYPSDVRGRKLPIYLADSPKNYTKIIAMLRGVSSLPEQTDSWGIYISTYSGKGNRVSGIVIHPEPWKNDVYAKATLWHEMNHYEFFASLDYSKVVEPYLWVVEGLAEYFSETKLDLNSTIIHKLQKEAHLNRGFQPLYYNYVGGHSVFQTIHSLYGKNKVKDFVRKVYISRMNEVYPAVLQISESKFESIWKNNLPKLVKDVQ